jgi:acyl-coenzyme A synthetase/AMP-(fatty) acid ligase
VAVSHATASHQGHTTVHYCCCALLQSELAAASESGVQLYSDFVGSSSSSSQHQQQQHQHTPVLHFEPLPFSHPVYIMFSSGTTGLPKCMVHSAGGTLLQQVRMLKSISNFAHFNHINVGVASVLCSVANLSC